MNQKILNEHENNVYFQPQWHILKNQGETSQSLDKNKKINLNVQPKSIKINKSIKI